MLNFFITMNTIYSFGDIKYSAISFSNKTLTMWAVNL